MSRRAIQTGPASAPILARFLAPLALTVLLLPASVPAASGGAGGVPPSGSPAEPRRILNDSNPENTMAQRALPASVQIEGRVHTATNQPLAGLRVRLFSNGVAIETVSTDVDGSFLLTANPMAGENNTSDLWIESPDLEKYLDVNVVVSAGRAAREQSLFSECTPRINGTGTGAVLDVTMFSIDEKKANLVSTKCLESEPD